MSIKCLGQDSHSINRLEAGGCFKEGTSKFSSTVLVYTSICHHLILVSELEFFKGKSTRRSLYPFLTVQSF